MSMMSIMGGIVNARNLEDDLSMHDLEHLKKKGTEGFLKVPSTLCWQMKDLFQNLPFA